MSEKELYFIIEEVSKRVCNYVENMIKSYLSTHLENRIDIQNDLPIVEAITVDELISLLKISKPVAYELVNSENFPSFRVGRNIRIDKHLLADWMLKQIGEKKGFN